MAEASKGLSLTKIFTKAAFWGLSLAFGFYVMGVFDFVMFHELAEGQAFMQQVGPAAADLLRADIPILGFSIADSFTALGNWLGGGGTALAGAAPTSHAVMASAGKLSTGFDIPLN
jgi:hypothetical protein